MNKQLKNTFEAWSSKPGLMRRRGTLGVLLCEAYAAHNPPCLRPTHP